MPVVLEPRLSKGKPALRLDAALAVHHAADDGGAYFGIAELCAEYGVTARALRFYEDKGLLAPKRLNGTRVYSRRDRARLAIILRSKAIGASLEDIRHYLDLYGHSGEGRVQQMRYVLERTAKAIAELEHKREQLDASLAELRQIHDTVRAHLAAR
jgi:DNA-binding transcriptional MerR regulator